MLTSLQELYSILSRGRRGIWLGLSLAGVLEADSVTMPNSWPQPQLTDAISELPPVSPLGFVAADIVGFVQPQRDSTEIETADRHAAVALVATLAPCIQASRGPSTRSLLGVDYWGECRQSVELQWAAA